jgi:hypothetical protein
MDAERDDNAGVSPASPAWLGYYERAARRRGGHGDLDHRRLRAARKRRKRMERVVIVASLAVVLLLAWMFDALLTR